MKIRITLYSVINCTTGKYYCVASIDCSLTTVNHTEGSYERTETLELHLTTCNFLNGVKRCEE